MRRPGAIVLACLALAAASTLLPWALAFDPEAWLVWGRESLHLALATSGGPSWKPLPVLLTTVFAVFGSAAPWAWLVVARAGGLLAVAGAAALAHRLTGSRAAAVTAAGLVAVSAWWAYNSALGNSEGLLGAAVLWAIWAHAAGHRRGALGLGLAAALLRPETWPFLGIYVLWLWRAEPGLRRAGATALALIPALWLGPELLSSGHPLRAADAARGTPSAGNAALDAHPVLAVFRDAAQLMTVPVACLLGAAVVLAFLARRREGWRDPVVLLAGAALAWVALVAAMTAAGFAGNPRYGAPAAAIGAVAAACGLARLPRDRTSRSEPRGVHIWTLNSASALRGAAAAFVLAVVAVLQAGALDDQRADITRRASVRGQLEQLVSSAGGARALRMCGPIRAYGPTTTAVAWRLDVALKALPWPAGPSDVVFRERWQSGDPLRPAAGALARLRVAARTRDWELRTRCQRAG